MLRKFFIAIVLVSAMCPGDTIVSAQSPTPTPKVDKAGEDAIDRIVREAAELWKQGTAESLASAAEKYISAADLARKGGTKESEARHLGSAAACFNQLGNGRKALEYYIRALQVTPDDQKGLEADILSEAGSLFNAFGNHGTALQIFTHEREIRHDLEDTAGEVGALHNAAMVLNELGDMQRAKTIYEEILKIERDGEDKRILTASINNLAYVYYRLDDFRKAADLYDESYQIALKAEIEDVQAATLIGLGDAFHKLGDEAKAVDFYNRGLRLSRKVRNPIFEADADYGLGTVYQAKGEKQRAREFYDKALALQDAANALEQASKTLASEMSVWKDIGEPTVAILYGKRAINMNQSMRGMLKGISKETQRLYLKSKESIYRELGNILISEGRLPEAQAVLDLLKEQEYEQFTKLRSGDTADTVPYSKAETETVAKIDALAAFTRRKTELDETKESKGSLTGDEQTELGKVLADIETANKAFRLSLEALGKTEASVGEKIGEIGTEKNLQRSLGSLRKELNTGVVAIYTVIGTEDVKAAGTDPGKSRAKFGWAVMITPEGRKAYPIDVGGLEENVQAFRNALRSPQYDPRPPAQKLYNAIFRQTSVRQKKTLEADLAEVLGKYKDKTVMWSLDGVLRYVPMAALHDGKQYLVEKYRNTVFTKQSLLLLNEKDSAKWATLGLGVSEPKTVDNQNFIALDGAKRELEDIVRQPNEKTGIFEGTRRLNKDFTKDATMQLLRDGKYQAVHIASHFSFNPIDQNASFLVIGDGKLTFADIQDKDNLLGSVDLLTLSACDTGMSSNGKESEGFPFLAQSLGAKTVIASLWKVSDKGTPELMIRFYKLRAENPAMSKGEAFRQAQLSLLMGTADSGGGSAGGRRSDPIALDDSQPGLSPFTLDTSKPFAHPHFWASFVLIGNWR